MMTDVTATTRTDDRAGSMGHDIVPLLPRRAYAHRRRSFRRPSGGEGESHRRRRRLGLDPVQRDRRSLLPGLPIFGNDQDGGDRTAGRRGPLQTDAARGSAGRSVSLSGVGRRRRSQSFTIRRAATWDRKGCLPCPATRRPYLIGTDTPGARVLSARETARDHGRPTPGTPTPTASMRPLRSRRWRSGSCESAVHTNSVRRSSPPSMQA